ncbi:hypothetical protein MES4922_190411 [Mesorhizobium ventifaucium]|uniref:Uncharacterized protein n=1 Tax=Mesorhizobium ventifaucium TaxID=666020 RepID=A0ABN8JPI8_9HYPH|nr:hypothetical protein MES4922_190411 [Mesorhizobium ventifaucium]
MVYLLLGLILVFGSCAASLLVGVLVGMEGEKGLTPLWVDHLAIVAFIALCAGCYVLVRLV